MPLPPPVTRAVLPDNVLMNCARAYIADPSTASVV
jgi:hypothetical protein